MDSARIRFHSTVKRRNISDIATRTFNGSRFVLIRQETLLVQTLFTLFLFGFRINEDAMRFQLICQPIYVHWESICDRVGHHTSIIRNKWEIARIRWDNHCVRNVHQSFFTQSATEIIHRSTRLVLTFIVVEHSRFGWLHRSSQIGIFILDKAPYRRLTFFKIMGLEETHGAVVMIDWLGWLFSYIILDSRLTHIDTRPGPLRHHVVRKCIRKFYFLFVDPSWKRLNVSFVEMVNHIVPLNLLIEGDKAFRPFGAWQVLQSI